MLLIFALLVAKLSTNKNNIEIVSVYVVEPNVEEQKLVLPRISSTNAIFSFVFRSFDKQNTGKISEKVFKQIMLGKDDVNESEIEEMLEEYYR